MKYSDAPGAALSGLPPLTGPTADPLWAKNFHWGLRYKLLSSVGPRFPPSRRALVQWSGCFNRQISGQAVRV